MIDTLCNDRNKFVDSRFCETARRDVTERERCSVSEIRIYLGTIDFDLNWLFVIIGSVDGKFWSIGCTTAALRVNRLCACLLVSSGLSFGLVMVLWIEVVSFSP